MKNISGQYQDLLEGKMSQAQFLRNARMMFPNFVTQHNSFADSITILKQKGMLNEGDAVKGTPDKEPTYDYPTQPGKYKKVEQSPEVDEQDGIYPATTLTDIPKEEVSKPIKSKNRPDGLEDIKNNDTKNEMKKVKVVKENLGHNEISSIHPEGRFWVVTYITADGTKEKSFESEKEARKFYSTIDKNQRSFDDIFADFVETDDSTEIKAYIKSKGKEAISKIKAELPKTPDRIRKVLAKLLKVELDEVKTNKTSFDYKSTFEDLVVKTNTASKSDFGSIKQDWIEKVENSKINPDTKKQMLNSIKAINSLLDLQKFASYGLLKYEKMAIKTEAQTQQIPADTLSVINLLKRVPMLDQKLYLINNAAELQDVFDYILDRVNPSLETSVTQLRTALNQAIQANLNNKKAEKQAGISSSDSIKNKLNPAITKKAAPKLENLISRIMNETLSKKSAR